MPSSGPARRRTIRCTAQTLAGLVAWASGRPGVVGLVTAYTGDDRLVVGVALDGETDPDEVRASAPAPVEPFAPARGLDPVHLRLSRASTRIWTRRAERAQPEPARPTAGTLQRPDLPAVVDQGPPPTRDTEDARGDVTVDGFTLVGIDRDTAVGKGEPQPDQQDAALVEFATAEPGAIALLRGVTDEGLKVYCLAVEADRRPRGRPPRAGRRRGRGRSHPRRRRGVRPCGRDLRLPPRPRRRQHPTLADHVLAPTTCRAGGQAPARRRSRARSCSLVASSAARAYSARASSARPSEVSSSPRTLGSRW